MLITTQPGISYDVRLLKEVEVKHNIQQILSWIDEGLSFGLMDTNADMVMRRVFEGQYELWGCIHRLDNKIHGIFITAFYQYDLRKTLKAEICAGWNMPEWLGEAIETFSRYAVSNGADALEAEGRPGWGRIMRNHGVKETYRTYVKDLARC